MLPKGEQDRDKGAHMRAHVLVPLLTVGGVRNPSGGADVLGGDRAVGTVMRMSARSPLNV